MPLNRLKYVETGLDHIDRALGMLKPGHVQETMRGVPMQLETKFVAASTFMRIPDDVFHRRAAGRRLLDEVLADPAFAAAPESFRATVQAVK